MFINIPNLSSPEVKSDLQRIAKNKQLHNARDCKRQLCEMLDLGLIQNQRNL